MKPIRTLTCPACGRVFPAAMLVCRCDRDAPAPLTSGLAVAGAATSILFPALGLVLSIGALGQIRGSNGELTGAGLAVAGILMSLLNIALVLAIVLG